jgi:outer membrane protein assembly factor BamB
MVKHDPQFTGRSAFKGPQSSVVDWIIDMPYGIFSGPIIGTDKSVYFGSYYVFADFFYSYTNDGELKWIFETGSDRPPQSGILIDSSNTIYFGSRDSCFYALNQNGSLKWKFKTSAAIVQEIIPNIDLQGNIYFTNFIFSPSQPDQGELYSLKGDGTLNWKVMYDNGFAFKSPVFSPDGNTIYIAGVDSNLFALDLDGDIKWKFSCSEIMRAPMIDSYGNVYFIPNPVQSPQYIYSLTPDGNIRWQYEMLLATKIYSIPTIDYDGNLYSVGIDTAWPYYKTLFSLDYFGNFRWKYVFNENLNDDFWQPLICDSEGTVYIGSTNGYNYYAISNEGDLKWKLPLSGFEQQVDNTGAISINGTLFLGVHHSSLYSTQSNTLIAIRDTVTPVDEYNSQITFYNLDQNYPNPFNFTTNIKYIIPQSGRVTLTIQDIMGCVVATLLDRYQEAGSYDVIFQPKDIASGVYFYTLSSGDYMATKKLILLK